MTFISFDDVMRCRLDKIALLFSQFGVYSISDYWYQYFFSVFKPKYSNFEAWVL